MNEAGELSGLTEDADMQPPTLQSQLPIPGAFAIEEAALAQAGACYLSSNVF